MDLLLCRKDFREDGIFGELSDEDGNRIAVTLEHAYPVDKSYEPKLPAGEYACVRGLHRLEGMTRDFPTFEITGVEGHADILFHWGNFTRDSAGCVLLGKSVQPSPTGQMIKDSKITFAKFMSLMTGINEFTLTVVDAI